MVTLRDYQVLGVEHAVWALEAGQRTLYSAPTGTGKSLIELEVQARTEDCWIVTPKIEIIAGMLEKIGVRAPFDMSRVELVRTGLKNQIVTPMTLRNLLLKNEMKPPRRLIIDEAHHHSSDTGSTLDLLCGMCPAVGFTATPFRGTPRATAALRKTWPEHVPILTYPEATERHVIEIPLCETVPLVDDDEIEIVNGEFVARQIEGACKSKIQDIASLCEPWFDGEKWDRPTMFSAPTVEIAHLLREQMGIMGYPSSMVLGTDHFSYRAEAFNDMLWCRSALVQIQTVSEGVDLPIRRLVDLHPMMSPVEWLQQFGRITRPGGESHYVCVNRNLLRHGYLLAGCIPSGALVSAQSAFPPSGRAATARAFGLEALGRLKAVELPRVHGPSGTVYAVQTRDGLMTREYCVIVLPDRPDPLWATRVNSPSVSQWGRWQKCEPPDALEGFASTPARALSDKQKAWFTKGAAYHGIKPDVESPKRVFMAFTMLNDLRERI